MYSNNPNGVYPLTNEIVTLDLVGSSISRNIRCWINQFKKGRFIHLIIMDDFTNFLTLMSASEYIVRTFHIYMF